MPETPFFPRRQSVPVKIGRITVGGDAPVVVQSMTNTDTADAVRSAVQVAELARAGSELVRLTINTEDAAKSIPDIKNRLLAMGLDVPLIGDFHFNGHKLLTKYPDCAQALDKFRINPGNVGRGKKRSLQFGKMIEFACLYQKPIRIGVNWGSLDQDLLARMLDENNRQKNPLPLEDITHAALLESALSSAQQAEHIGLPHNRIILSCKLSGVRDLIRAYRDLASQCDYPLHLGLTEAGMGRQGIVASTSALSILLAEGIGDTIRISLTPQPGGSRTEEVLVAQDILQSLGLRSFTPHVVACPGCGRTSSDYFQRLAEEIQNYLVEQMPVWRNTYPGVETMSVAVMGCVVNGPGESRHANIGISLPGSGETPVAPVYVDGEKTVTLKGATIADDFKQLVTEYVSAHYAT